MSEFETDYPLAHTNAVHMLAEGLRSTQAEQGIPQRQIALRLGYKTSVALSHMALGRVPIPIDRAPEMARELGLNERAFVIAVLEQRHPEIMQYLGHNSTAEDGREPPTRRDDVVADLEAIAGQPLREIPAAQMRVIREALSDRDAKRRWLSVGELPTVELLREIRPHFPENGLTHAERDAIGQLLRSKPSTLS